MNIDYLSESEIKNMEAQVAEKRKQVNPFVQNYGSVESLSDSEIGSMEAEVAARRGEVKPFVENHGSVESLSDVEIGSMEAEIAVRRREVKPFVENYGSVESLSDSEIRGMEAEIAARRREVKPTYQHYGSAENLSETDIQILEAQVAEKRKADIPYKEYFSNLINNPSITDENEFEAATIRSMQSNGIINKFIEELFDKLGEKTFELKNVDKNDKTTIESIKREIESYVQVYVKYMYMLKKNEWEFHNLHAMEMPEYIRENIWQLQKNLDIEFKMPIPANLGEYYGDQFEREGKMVPGLTFITQDLMGKEVNWHQILIYKENELTPSQRYRQRQEEKRQEFVAARNEEIQANLLHMKPNELEGAKHI